MPKSGQIQQRTLDAAFEFDGDDWEIRFRAWSASEAKAIGEGDVEQLADALAAHIVSWNLTHDDGTPHEVSKEWLRGVGLDYLRGLFEGLNQEMQVKKPIASTSSGGLRRVV